MVESNLTSTSGPITFQAAPDLPEEPIVIGGRAIPAGTALINIEPRLDTALIVLLAEIAKLKSWANSLVIVDETSLMSATEDIASVRKLAKSIEEKRREFTDPLNAHLKDINAYFKLVTIPLAETDQVISRKILSYRAELDRQRKEAEEINRLREEAAKKEAALNDGCITESVAPVPVPPQLAKTVKTEVGNSATRDNWKVEVIDFTSLPNEYKMPDMVKLGKVVRAGLRNIPGCRIWNEPSLTVTTK
jgi:hypothetical protein